MVFLIPRELTDRVETQITEAKKKKKKVKMHLYVVVETGYPSGEHTNTDN